MIRRSDSHQGIKTSNNQSLAHTHLPLPALAIDQRMAAVHQVCVSAEYYLQLVLVTV